MRIRRPRRRQVRAPDHQIARVPPITGLRHIRLIPERLRRRRRQIRVPVIERQDHPADQRQEPRPGRIRRHRHRRDRREPHHPIRAVALDRVHMRRRDQLRHLIPRRADEPALPALALVPPRALRVIDDLRPRVHRIAQPRSRLAEHLDQTPAHIRVAQPQRRVRVPRERRPPRTTTRLVLRRLRTDRRIVGRLRLPRDQPVLHEHLPRTRARAIHPVRRAHHLVVRPAPPVRTLPSTVLRDQLAPALRVHRPAAQEPMRLEQRASRARAGARRSRRGRLPAATQGSRGLWTSGVAAYASRHTIAPRYAPPALRCRLPATARVQNQPAPIPPLERATSPRPEPHARPAPAPPRDQRPPRSRRPVDRRRRRLPPAPAPQRRRARRPRRKRRASSSAHPTPTIGAPSVSRSPRTAPAASKRSPNCTSRKCPASPARCAPCSRTSTRRRTRSPVAPR